MAAPSRKRKPKAFLDSSILIAATLSLTGGSFRLLKESYRKLLKIYTNRYAVNEIKSVLTKKYPAYLERFGAISNWAQITILPNPSTRSVARYLKLIHPEDAPVLAGAINAKANFLITLDRKHFLNQKVLTAKLPIIITTPKEFFQLYWH